MVLLKSIVKNKTLDYLNEESLNRFNKLSINKYARGVGGCKTIINNFYDDIKDIQILSAHTCSKHENDYILTRDDGIVLKHIFTKSLEEWIMKMTRNIDNSYMARWHGYIFNEYFKWNEITNEKLDAIDDLLNKYNMVVAQLKEMQDQMKRKDTAQKQYEKEMDVVMDHARK